jgi:hypothetical protein
MLIVTPLLMLRPEPAQQITRTTMIAVLRKIFSPLLVLRGEPAQQSPPTTIALLTRSFSCSWAFLFFAATKVAMFFKITRQLLYQLSCETTAVLPLKT